MVMKLVRKKSWMSIMSFSAGTMGRWLFAMCRWAGRCRWWRWRQGEWTTGRQSREETKARMWTWAITNWSLLSCANLSYISSVFDAPNCIGWADESSLTPHPQVGVNYSNLCTRSYHSLIAVAGKLSIWHPGYLAYLPSLSYKEPLTLFIGTWCCCDFLQPWALYCGTRWHSYKHTRT